LYIGVCLTMHQN